MKHPTFYMAILAAVIVSIALYMVDPVATGQIDRRIFSPQSLRALLFFILVYVAILPMVVKLFDKEEE
jgi:hypothetical protein